MSELKPLWQFSQSIIETLLLFLSELHKHQRVREKSVSKYHRKEVLKLQMLLNIMFFIYLYLLPNILCAVKVIFFTISLDYFLFICLFCTISYRMQLNCKYSGGKKMQFLSCQWSTLNQIWDRNSDRQWQKLMCESEVLTEMFLSDCYCTFLQVFLTGSDQVLTVPKTLQLNHISYWIYNLEKQM